jgi:YHS domain-containing protein
MLSFCDDYNIYFCYIFVVTLKKQKGEEMNKISKIRKASFSIASILIVFTVASCAQSLQAVNVDKDGIALKGYDPVAYFDEGRPVKGTEEYSFEWKGAKWLFSSKEHLESFGENPEKFAPQYGGY